MKKVVLTLLLVNLFLGLIIYLWQGEGWLTNFQIAFFSSSLIMLASMKSHKNMVSRALEAGAVSDDGRDTLDKLEDPYDLYDEDKIEEKDEEKTLVEVVKEERANLKKGRRSIWETTKDAKASFSFYRLGSYLFLVFGFFYLNNNHILELIPYLLSLSIPFLVVVFSLLNDVEK